MKHMLLSVVALAGAMFASTSAFAQWAEPTPPALNEVNATAVESGHTYFIKNVGAGQFITGSNNWSTQISLTRAGVNDTYSPALAIYVADSTGNSTNLRGVVGVSMRLNGTYTVNGASGARTFTDTYLFRDGSATQGFMDHGTQDMGYIWKITKADNGYFRIQTAEGDPAYPNAALEFAGWDSSMGPIEVDEETGELIDASVSTEVNFAMEEDVEGNCIDWMFIPADEFVAQKAAYNSRLQLYEKYVEVMEEADALGLTVNTSIAEAIYNNAAATVDDMKEAIADLTYQLNQAKFLSDFEGASLDDPVEVTGSCLVNPDFSAGNISGWTCTFVSGVTATNVGYQGASYTNNGSALTGETTDDDGNASYLNQFIEAWRPNEQDPHHIGDAELSQTVYGLPAGMYKLTCDAVANQQGGYFPNPVTGVILFISTDAGTGKEQEIATGNGIPEHFSVTFVCPEGVKGLTFGLKTQDATANWIAADNFRIYYYGKTDLSPAHVELNDMVQQAQFAEITEDENANVDILNNYIKTLENAEAISQKGSPSDEECNEATAALRTALAEAQQSIKDYVKLNELVEEAKDLSEKAYTAGFQDAADAVDNLWEEWEGLYEERTATKELIDSIDGLASKTLKETVIENIQDLKPGTDLTILLENPGFTRGNGGRDLTAKDAVPGWVLNSGRIVEHRASIHNIESYHVGFDMSQTIAKLPAGVYDVTLQGFVRHDNTSATDGTWLYGGITKANLIDLDRDVTQKRTERIFGDDKPGLGDENRDNQRGSDFGTDVDEEGNPLYQCNGMTGAYYWFQEINPNTNELYYTNHVKVLHEKDGDLTIGIHCEAAEDWVIWDNFAIKYVGQDASLIRKQLEEILEEFAEVNAAENAFLTAKAAENAVKIPEEAQKVMDDDNASEMLAKIKEVSEAIDYVKAGNKLSEELFSTVNTYTDRVMDDLGDLVPTDDKYVETLDYWQDGGEFDPTTLADNDAITALIEQIKNGWVAYLMSGANGATAVDPINVTPVLVNPNYDYQNQDGWTSQGSAGFADGYAEIEFYNQNFDHRQSIKGLTPGFYKITVSGYYRAGFPGAARDALVGDSLQYNAVMFAIAGDSIATPLLNIFEGAQEYELTYDGTEITVELPNEDGDTIPLFIPNMMSSAFDYLATEMYENELIVEVGEGGELTVGISKDVHIDGDWTIFNNWNIWFLGTEPPVAVKGIEADQTAGTEGKKAIYNLAGQKVSTVQKGIYIVNGKKVAVK